MDKSETIFSFQSYKINSDKEFDEFISKTLTMIADFGIRAKFETFLKF